VGRVARRVGSLVAFVLLLTVALARPAPAAGFSGFGAMTADATYGEEMRFTVKLPGGAPDQLELLMRFTGADSTVVAPVDPGASSAEYVWDAAANSITPNTRIAYRWRATNGEVVTLSAEQALLYDDDRPGLVWRSTPAANDRVAIASVLIGTTLPRARAQSATPAPRPRCLAETSAPPPRCRNPRCS